MDEYKLTHDYWSKKVNAHIQIYQPILTEEERARRMQRIHDAAVQLALANRRHEARKQQEASRGHHISVRAGSQ